MSRLLRYEKLLRKHGINFEDDAPEIQAASAHPAQGELEYLAKLSINAPGGEHAQRGTMFTDQNNTRYVEKYGCSFYVVTLY